MHVPTSSKDEQERPPLRRLAERYFVKLNSFGQKKLLCLCTEGTSVPSEDCYLSHGKLLAYIRSDKYPQELSGDQRIESAQHGNETRCARL